jgi:hypothetical protein
MRGKPQFNFPAFHRAAAMLRAAGHEVFSPAERDERVYGKEFALLNTTGDEALSVQNSGFSLREALEADTQYICRHAEGIALLPGWNKSKGAQAELALAKALGLEVIWLEE